MEGVNVLGKALVCSNNSSKTSCTCVLPGSPRQKTGYAGTLWQTVLAAAFSDSWNGPDHDVYTQ